MRYTTAMLAAAGQQTYYGRPCQYGHRLRYSASRHCVECQRQYDRRRTDAYRSQEDCVRAGKAQVVMRAICDIQREEQHEALLRAYELGRRHGQQGRNTPLTVRELVDQLRSDGR